jgi:hypothetical protein
LVAVARDGKDKVKNLFGQGLHRFAVALSAISLGALFSGLLQDVIDLSVLK